jgi:hypothetical protein
MAKKHLLLNMFSSGITTRKMEWFLIARLSIDLAFEAISEEVLTVIRRGRMKTINLTASA